MSRPGDTTYEIARASGTCAATGAPLTPGDPYIAALVERDGEEGYQRLDYSLEAWERGERPQPPLRLFGYWRARYEPGERKQQPLIDNDSMIDLFEQLEGAQDPARQSFRYILALLLIRKRLLKFEGARREDLPGGGQQSIMLLRRATPIAEAANAPTYEVLDPGMDDTQIAAAIEQLRSVMAV